MAKLGSTKTITVKAKAPTEGVIGSDASTPEASVHEQQKRSEMGQFCVQVDRQTKASYATYEAAEQAALAIKKGYPIVRVAVYDTVERVNKVIELP